MRTNELVTMKEVHDFIRKNTIIKILDRFKGVKDILSTLDDIISDFDGPDPNYTIKKYVTKIKDRYGNPIKLIVQNTYEDEDDPILISMRVYTPDETSDIVLNDRLQLSDIKFIKTVLLELEQGDTPSIYISDENVIPAETRDDICKQLSKAVLLARFAPNTRSHEMLIANLNRVQSIANYINSEGYPVPFSPEKSIAEGENEADTVEVDFKSMSVIKDALYDNYTLIIEFNKDIDDVGKDGSIVIAFKFFLDPTKEDSDYDDWEYSIFFKVRDKRYIDLDI